VPACIHGESTECECVCGHFLTGQETFQENRAESQRNCDNALRQCLCIHVSNVQLLDL
jgi:hypothetical protein